MTKAPVFVLVIAVAVSVVAQLLFGLDNAVLMMLYHRGVIAHMIAQTSDAR